MKPFALILHVLVQQSGGGGIDKEVKKLTTKDDISFLTYTENTSRIISVNKEI